MAAKRRASLGSRKWRWLHCFPLRIGFWLGDPKCGSGEAIQRVSLPTLPLTPLHLGRLHQTYLTSRPSSTWALRLAWQHINSPAASESLPHEQTSHRPGRWPGKSLWASKTKGETPQSCTACGSLLPGMRGEKLRGPTTQKILEKKDSLARAHGEQSCFDSCSGHVPWWSGDRRSI